MIVTERKVMQPKCIQNIFNESTEENVTNLEIEIIIQVQETFRTPHEIE
jgi:uncharacterized membrane protein